VASADGVLRHLGEQGIRVAHEQLGQGAALVEGVAQALRLQAVTVAGALDHGRAHGALVGQQRGADDALVADHGDFRGGAVFHHVQQGDDGRGGKISVVERAAIVEQFFAERQFNEFQVFKQGFEGVAGQGGQQFVLLGATVADGHGGARRNLGKLMYPRSRVGDRAGQRTRFWRDGAKLSIVHVLFPHRLNFFASDAIRAGGRAGGRERRTPIQLNQICP